jgi:hypothetical protein
MRAKIGAEVLEAANPEAVTKEALMPRYCFHEHVRGQKTEDLRGKLFPTDAAACHGAVQRMPTGLKRAAERSRNTYSPPK